MYEEYYAKAKEFQDNLATMAETIKTRRQSEIVDLENRISTFQQTASQELQQNKWSLLVYCVIKSLKLLLKWEKRITTLTYLT